MKKDSPDRKVNPIVSWWKQRQFLLFRESFLPFALPVYFFILIIWITLVYNMPNSWIPALLLIGGVSVIGAWIAYRTSQERWVMEKEWIDEKEEWKQESKELFIAFIKNDSDFTYEVHLVNPTDFDLYRIDVLTWGIAGDSDGLLQTDKGIRRVDLKPCSSLLLEKDSRTMLDFVIVYHLDIYASGGHYPLLLKFNLPKGHWEYTTSTLPILKREGMRIDLKERDPREIIEKEIAHMNMDSSYKTNDELLAP